MTAEVWQFVGALVFLAAILFGSYWFVYLPGKTPDQAVDVGQENGGGQPAQGENRRSSANER